MGQADCVGQHVGLKGQEEQKKKKVFYLPLAITTVLLSTILTSAFHSTSGDQSSATSVVPGNASSSPANSVYLGCGMTGKIRCPLRPNPPDVVIVWLKDDRPMDLMTSSVAKRLRMDRRGNIVIRPVQVTDEGLYTCSTYSPMSSSIRSPTIQVLVRDPPYFIVRPSAIYQSTPGQTVTMPCVASGDPPPNIIWNKVFGPFPSIQRRDQEEGNITLARLTLNDSGSYECIAFNPVASVVTTTILIVESQTNHGPYNLSVFASTTFALLSWLPSYDNDLQQRYVIWYRALTIEWEIWQTIDVEPPQMTSVTLHGLTPNTTYQFMIMSRDQLGRELFSSTFTTTTKRLSHVVTDLVTTLRSVEPPLEQSRSSLPTTRITANRPHPPSTVQVTAAKGGLQLRWAHPHRSPVPAKYFVVEYRTVGQWVPLTGKTTSLSFLWTTVSRGAVYQFRVIGYAGDGATPSDPSETVSFHTEGDSISPGTVRFGEVAMGGLIAGLLFVIISAAFVFLVVRILRRRRSRQKENRYQNVKYFGPNHHANANDKNEVHDDDNIFDQNQVITKCVSTNIAQQEFCDKNRGSHDVIMTEVIEAEATV